MADDNEIDVKFGADTGELEGHMAQIREMLQGLTNPLRALRENLGEISEAFLAAFAVEKIEAFMSKFAELGATIEHMSQRIGVSTDDLQMFAFAAGTVGVSLESAGMAMQRLELHMTRVSQGVGGAAAEAFSTLDINVKRSDGSMKSVLEIMGEIGDKFSVTADGAVKTATAIELFGRAGANMIPYLNLGKEGMAEVDAQAKALGLTLSEQTIKGMEDTAIELYTMEAAFRRLGAAIFDAAKPAIDAIITSVTYLSAGIAMNIDWLHKWVTAFDISPSASEYKNTMDSINSKMEEQKGIIAALTASYAVADETAQAAITIKLKTATDRLAILQQEQASFQKKIDSLSQSDSTSTKPPLIAVETYKEASAQLKQLLADQQVTDDQMVGVEIDFWRKKLDVAKEGSAEYAAIQTELNKLINTGLKEVNAEDLANQAAASKGRIASLTADQAQANALDKQAEATHRITTQQYVADEKVRQDAMTAALIAEAQAKGRGKLSQISDGGEGGPAQDALNAAKRTEIEATTEAEIVQIKAQGIEKQKSLDTQYVTAQFAEGQKLIDQASTLSQEESAIKFTAAKLDVANQAATGKISQDQKFEDLKQIASAETADEVQRLQARIAAGGLDVAARKKIEDEIVIAHQKGEQQMTQITEEQTAARYAVARADMERNVRTQSELASITLQTQRDEIQAEADMGQISTQRKINELRVLTDAEFAQKIADEQALQQSLNVEDKAYKDAADRIIILTAQRTAAQAKLEQQSAAATAKVWTDVANVISTQMDTALVSILNKTSSFSDAMKTFWNNMVIQSAEALLRMGIQETVKFARDVVMNNTALLNWLGVETAKTAATTTGEAQRTAATSVGAANRTAVGQTENAGFFTRVGQSIAEWLGFETTKTSETTAGTAARTTVNVAADLASKTASIVAAFGQIEVDAAVAAAGAFAATALIPYVGPELAPAAATAAYTATMGWATGLGAGLFAEKGALIPTGVSPLVRLHQNEIVLPEGLSSGLQGMIANSQSSASGGGGGGSKGTDGQTINVYVTQTNPTPDQIAVAIGQAARKYHPALRR